ncbi:MAG: molecular chaperone DnaK [Thermoprotei archaeon]|nr:molecular chaperone DnaK [TACK group archaeon]
MTEKILGIDLGTSNSAAAIMQGGRPVVIPSAEGITVWGGKAFPSYVAFTKDGQLLVGEPARRQAATNPEGTVAAWKRKIGTNYKYNIYGKEYTPEQLSAFLLQKIKKDAEAYLGEPVKKAVITVPAHFNDNQRQATKDAGTIAGLDVVRIINEPTASALAYGLNKSDKEMKILVFELGGGTYDVTLMEFGGGVFEVRATNGDTQLGGTDMDNAVVNYLVAGFKQQTGIDLTKDPMAMQRVREAAEKAKIELSSMLSTDINVPFIASDTTGPKHLTATLTRAKLEELVAPILEKTKTPLYQALQDAKWKKEDVDKIILVGGPTKMPIVQRFVQDLLGKPPERGIDPMECVAIGAAIQGAVLAGEISDIVLLDVTPLSLGVETLGGVFTKIIDRNTTIPTRKSQVFTTAADFQTEVTIHVLQGERPMAADNLSLGMFTLSGIPPAPRGVPQIEVTFDIDANGILNVTAVDKATGKQQKITISGSTRLTEEQKEKMIKEAEAYAEEDRRKKELAEAKNAADSLAYSAERSLADLGDKVSGELRERVKSAVASLREATSGSDLAAIRAKTEELQKVLAEVGSAAYSSAASQQGSQAGAQQGAQGASETKDANFKVEGGG